MGCSTASVPRSCNEHELQKVYGSRRAEVRKSCGEEGVREWLTLPAAVKSLFELNNYDVVGPREMHGAEIDLIATNRSASFERPVYIEVTIEYVDVTKYGKDLTKFAIIQKSDPGATCLIVSSTGFTPSVVERAAAAGITLKTYAELTQRFEKFDRYLTLLLDDGPVAEELAQLSEVYEPPTFRDVIGNEPAMEYLDQWIDNSDPKTRWLVVVGEYGTGKTALTRMLQRSN